MALRLLFRPGPGSHEAFLGELGVLRDSRVRRGPVRSPRPCTMKRFSGRGSFTGISKTYTTNPSSSSLRWPWSRASLLMIASLFRILLTPKVGLYCFVTSIFFAMSSIFFPMSSIFEKGGNVIEITAETGRYKIHSCFESIASWLGQFEHEHPRHTNNRLTLLQLFACLYIAVSDPLVVKSTIRTKVKSLIVGFSRKGNL